MEVIPDIRETDQELFKHLLRKDSPHHEQHEKFELFVKALNMWRSFPYIALASKRILYLHIRCHHRLQGGRGTNP